jgi:hypothetical protein
MCITPVSATGASWRPEQAREPVHKWLNIKIAQVMP